MSWSRRKRRSKRLRGGARPSGGSSADWLREGDQRTIIFAGRRGGDRPAAGAPAARVTLPVFLAEDGLVTDAQVRRLREKQMAGKTLAAAAAAAGMSERAARKWQSGPLPSTAKAPRWWRTREDPFAEVWQSEVVPQLVADTDGRLQVLTLFKALCRRHPGRFQPGQLRTLQRRIREWRVQVRSRPRGVLRAGSGPGSGSGVRLHRLERPGGDAAGRGVPAPAVRVGAELQPVDLCGAGAERDVRGAGVGPAGRAVDAGRGSGGAPSRQPVGGDARAEAQRRSSVDGAVPAGFWTTTGCARRGSSRGSRTRTGWPSRRTSGRRRLSSRRCCCGARGTSSTRRRICASCARWSTRSGMHRLRLGWPRSVRICGRCRRLGSRSTRRSSAGCGSGARSGSAAEFTRCRRG